MAVELIAPPDQAIVQQLTQKQREFIQDINGPDAESFDWKNLKQKKDEYSLPLPVEFLWKAPKKAQLVLAEDSNFSKCMTYEGDGNLSIYNLLIGKKYYWFVHVGDESSEIRSFTLDPMPPRVIMADGLSNVRDIGGRITAGGTRIQQGMVYRGCEMEWHHTITEKGIETLRNQLNIRTDLDLRFEAVGKITGSALGEDITYLLMPCRPYGEFIEDKQTATDLFRLFTKKENYPFYIHCWGGADRTGTLILILCGVLGVDDTALYEDYEFTSLSIWGSRSRKSELFITLLKALDRYEGKSLSERCIHFLIDCGITRDEMDMIRHILLES